jgi:DNA-binding PadR family transcriptional regulator
MIDIEKKFRDGKPVTTFQLTAQGRQRLADHARALLAAVEEPAADTLSDTVSVVAEEDWID